MPNYSVKFKFQGHADKDRTTVNWDLGVLADEAAALSAVSAIQAAYESLTEADLEVVLTTVVEPFDASPAYGVDTHDEAAVITFLNDVGTKKYNGVRIPAPVSSLIQPDGMAVNVADTDLIALIAALSANVLLSDGESIDTTVGNGIESGHVRSRAKSFK